MGALFSLATLALCSALLAGHATAGACEIGKLAELPVTMTGLRPMISAKINGAEASFIADSGAFYSLVSPSSAVQYRLKARLVPFNLTMRGIGGAVIPSLATVKTFTLANTPIPNVEFLVGGGDPGGGAAGLIGQNVLGLADVEYDLAGGAIRLMRPRGCGGRALAYWAGGKPYSVLKLSDEARRTAATVRVNGVAVHALFDTGDALSVLSPSAAARAGVKLIGPGVADGGVFRGLGRRPIPTRLAPVVSFKIGDEEIRDTRLRVGELDLDAGVDMLIGADFFLAHRVYVANSQGKLYFTYNGGPVFNLGGATRVQSYPGEAPRAAAPLTGNGNEPTDAEGFSRRGAAFAARLQFALAIADFTRACDMAPGEGRYFRQRGMARWAAGQPGLAMHDLDQALSLAPDDVDARVARAAVRLRGTDRSGAIADLDAASGLAAKQADVRLGLAELYERAGRLEAAAAQFSLWIAAHRDDSRLSQALNGRCWAAALSGRNLGGGLADCTAALKLAPRSAEILDSRGLVRLRLGDYDKAIADYDGALALAPKTAWSLYGRGLAKLRRGLKTQGEADIAAAAALQPGMAGEAKTYGIGPALP